MWLQLVKTFYIGQVACEQAVEAIKKQSETVCGKKDELKHKVQEFKSEKIFDKEKFEGKIKENVASLRKGFKTFDHACDALNGLLIETAEMKDSLILQESEKELVAS
ncbi:MAG: hypothetical protein JSS86_03470 [Cyanobacteria bacterium SZAS LIN-2]|nr:hypothetical protein [Cyanobacteria bacterium SZAS LIN-3]MBS1995339.1 hypothetical protein [Cyanobacteria bacterium SZAS LIN-2]MBS2009733.1 hypothetical protein [Cyanobacteria bacterium SZAS TMP-1]